SAVVRGLPADPALPLAGVPRPGVGVVRGVVRGAAGGGEPGADRWPGAAQPQQPARGQGKDVEVQEEASRASPCTALAEKLCGVDSYASLNGIASKPSRRTSAPDAPRYGCPRRSP